MIDIQEAIAKVNDRLRSYSEFIGMQLRLVESEIEEREWGWVMPVEPVDLT